MVSDKIKWRFGELRIYKNENMHINFRKKEHIEFDDFMDLDDANEWIYSV